MPVVTYPLRRDLGTRVPTHVKGDTGPVTTNHETAAIVRDEIERLLEETGRTRKSIDRALGERENQLSTWLTARAGGVPVEKWVALARELGVPDNHFFVLTELTPPGETVSTPPALIDALRHAEQLEREIAALREGLQQALNQSATPPEEPPPPRPRQR